MVALAIVALGANPATGHAVTEVRWCGSSASAADRFPDRVAGRQVHVVYAVASGVSASTAAANRIATDVSAIHAWWRGQDPTRAPRFDLHNFGPCSSTFGALDISHVALPRNAAHYAPDRFTRLREDLRGLGFTDTDKKYLVFYEAPLVGTEPKPLCGTGGGAFAINYLSGRCLRDFGTGARAALTAAHELLHALGAVAQGAPHRCADSGHVCDTVEDIMYVPHSISTSIFQTTLDVGRDDYYGHSGSWWDVADSRWLARLDRPQYALQVAVSDAGRVESDLPGLSCPPVCTAVFDAGTTVVLRATPTAGRVFVGWQGACSGTSTTCTVLLSSGRTARAVFALPNAAPTAQIAPLRSLYDIGQRVTFVSVSVDRDGSIASVHWSFGDGTVASASSATHRYRRAGTYPVTLTVTDDRGASATATASAVVRDFSAPRVSAARTATVRVKRLARLAFRVSDNSGAVAGFRIVIRNRGRVVAALRGGPTSADGAERSVRWRAPRRPARLTWCIRASDAAGNTTTASCGRLRVVR